MKQLTLSVAYISGRYIFRNVICTYTQQLKSSSNSSRTHTHRTFSDIISHLLSLHSHSQLEIQKLFLAACGQPHELLCSSAAVVLQSFSLKLTFDCLQPLGMARELLRIGQEFSGSNLTVIMQLSGRTAIVGGTRRTYPQSTTFWQIPQSCKSIDASLQYRNQLFRKRSQ